MQGLTNQLPKAFIDVKKVKRSFLSTENISVWIDVPKGISLKHTWSVVDLEEANTFPKRRKHKEIYGKRWHSSKSCI